MTDWIDHQNDARAKQKLKQINKRSIEQIKADIESTTDRYVAAGIDKALDSIESVIQNAMFNVLGVSKGSFDKGYTFADKNSPAYLVAHKKLSAMLSEHSDEWAAKAFKESIKPLKQATSQWMREEFVREFRRHTLRFIEDQARSMADALLDEAKQKVGEAVKELFATKIVLPQAEGKIDASDPNLFEMAAMQKVLPIIAEQLTCDT